MKKLSHVGLIAALTLAPVLARADADDDATTAEALAQTHQLLDDPPKSDADLDAIYALSAELMANLIDASGGDPERMQRMLEEANHNPELFAARLSPEQRKKLAALAKQVEPGSAQKP